MGRSRVRSTTLHLRSHRRCIGSPQLQHLGSTLGKTPIDGSSLPAPHCTLRGAAGSSGEAW
eukprot:3836155-Rhodomonas_salina.1